MTDPVNPYIAGNPVTGEPMFFGREGVFAFVRQALTGQHRDNVIVLYGQRRTGKTSTLYQMHRHLDARYVCIIVDLHGLALNGLAGFIWELAQTIARALRRDHHIDLPRLNRADFAQDARATFEDDFLPHVWTAIGDRHVLLMLDEAIRLQEQVAAGKLETEVFEYLRHLMQHHDRLNFLFALGSGLEEMEKEYAFLFSVGLYHKISFLTRDAATTLITQPVKDYYRIEPSAIDRILQITSGHPYFTQLLCHTIFNHWLQQRPSQIRTEDVNLILSEVVERGLAVLKQVWEDGTPGEKAVMAGLAATTGRRPHPTTMAEIDRVWSAQGVNIPDGEKIKAIRGLIARDVVSGEDRYEFAVELQRLWIQKYERLEWVKEEIAESIQQWQLLPDQFALQQQLKRQRTDRLTVSVILGLLAGLIFVMFLGLRSLNESYDQERTYRRTLEAQVTKIAQAVATATAAAYAPASTATAAAEQLYGERLTVTALAQRCALPETVITDLLTRLNQLRQGKALLPVQWNEQFANLAQQQADARTAGTMGANEPDSVSFQGCQLDEVWTNLAADPTAQPILLDARYSEVGIGVASGSLNEFVLKFGVSTPVPLLPATETATPSPVPVAPTSTAGGPLHLNWEVESKGPNPDDPDQWLIVVNLTAYGGDGQYRYYHDSLLVPGPRIEIVYRACRDKPGSFWVADGSGQIVKIEYFFRAPYCPSTPTSP
jgi:hypothetical protein